MVATFTTTGAIMTRLKLVFAAALIAAAAPAFAGTFICHGVVSASVVCADAIASGVTEKFTKKYPSSKYTIFATSGRGTYADGSYSGSAAVWLGSTASQVPDPARYSAIYFTGTRANPSDLLADERGALLDATKELMFKLGMGDERAQVTQRAPQGAGRQCRTVQVTEQTLQSEYVCDYNNLGPTNCRNENKNVPRTVDKQVCS
jgi:hypothetical protein